MTSTVPGTAPRTTSSPAAAAYASSLETIAAAEPDVAAAIAASWRHSAGSSS